MVLTAVGYGRAVGLSVARGAEAQVRAALPWWWTDAAVEPERVWEVDDATTTVRAMELWVAEHARDHVFVHAAVVAVGDRALLLPGRSTTGKTELTAALLRRGADFCSDEYAVLDAGGAVHPYPRPLSVRRADGTRLAVLAREFGAATATRPVRVAAVAVCRYLPGARWAPVPLTPSRAVLAVLDNTVSARTSPAVALDAVTAALADAEAVTGDRGEADDAAAALLDLLAAAQGTM